MASQIQSILLSLPRRVLIRLRILYVRHILRKPFWYTDCNRIRMELLPEENLYYYFTSRQLLDDPGSVALLQRTIKPGMTVFDIGAHAGAFSLLAAQRLQGRGNVHAFEPTSGTYARLMRNIEQNHTLASSIRPNQLAIAGTDGHVTLNTFPAHLSVWNTMGRPEMQDERGLRVMPSTSEVVEAITVDTYCRERGVQKIDLLKIDVEGFEDDVIAGCTQMIRQHAIDNVLFEISLAPLKGTGKSPRTILHMFANLGFQLYQIEEDGSTSEIGNIDNFSTPFFANYFGVYRRA